MKVKYILGTVTILAIIGGTIYAIKKHKDQEKLEGEAISLQEAEALVKCNAIQKNQSERLMTPYSKIDVEVTREIFESISENTDNVMFAPRFVDETLESVSVVKVRKADQVDIDEVLEEYDDEDENEEETVLQDIDIDSAIRDINTEEEEKLRYEPNSNEARAQYIRMELAEWMPNDEVYKVLNKLFDFPFQPQNDGDEFLRTNIIDYRVRFFGFNSRWVKDVSYADVILHYARAAQYNCDESVRYWVEYFLEFNEFDALTSSLTIDELLQSLNAHSYYNEERQTFGLFGLTSNSMDQAIRIANRNIDSSVTYEIEFNEFLKSCL
jgi:hypothetical protein